MNSASKAPRAVVAEMRAVLERGSTPPALTEFLKKSFPPRRAAWLAAILGPPTIQDADYEARRVEEFDDGGFFTRSCVFELTATDGLLEGNHLPHGGSFGLCALGEAGLSYLMKRPGALEALFRAEARPLDEGDPLALARLFAETLERIRTSSALVLRSRDDLARFRAGTRFEGQYELNPAEWDRVQARVHPPQVSGDARSGWRLEYWSVFGWMDAKKTLLQHRLVMDPSFRIESTTSVVSQKIFSLAPSFRY